MGRTRRVPRTPAGARSPPGRPGMDVPPLDRDGEDGRVLPISRPLHPALNLIVVIAYIVVVGTVVGLIAGRVAHVADDVAIGAGIVAILTIGVVKWPVWLFRLVFRQEPRWPDPPPPSAIEVRSYRGRDQQEAVRAFRRDAERLAAQGYEIGRAHV